MARAGTIVLLAAVYFVAAKLGLHLALVDPYASAVWPFSGIALVALLLFGRSVWPGVYIGAFLANLTNGSSVGPVSVVISIAIAGGNTLEAIAGAWLTERFAGGLGAFDRSYGVFRFSALAAGASTLISASIGVLSLTQAGLAPASNAAAIMVTWWIGDAAGDLVVAPLLILWKRQRDARWNRTRAAETASAMAAALILAAVSFTGLIAPQGRGLGLAFLCFPALLWPAFRLGLPETAVSLVLVDGVAIWAWQRGFMTGDLAPTFVPLELQAYIGVTAIMLLAIAAEREYAARQHRELLLVTDDAPVALAHCDREGRYRFANPAYAARFGLEPEQIVGRKMADVAGPENYERHRAYAEAALGGKRVNFEIEASPGRVDRGSYVPERDRAGAPAGFISASVDVTAEKRAEARLKQEYALREAIENSMLTGVAAVDAEGRQTYVNPAFCRMVAYSAEELVGKSAPFVYWPAEEIERIQSAFEQTLRGEAPPSGFTLRFERRDGERFDAMVMISPWRIGDCQAGWIASISDITERHRLHEHIKGQQELLRLVIDGMPGLVAYIGRDYRYQFVNRGYSEWFERSGSEIEGRTVADLAGKDAFQEIRPQLDRALAGEPVEFERRFQYVDRERVVRARYVPDRAPDGNVRGVVVLVEDITDKAEAVRALRESEEKFRRIVETASEGIWIVDPEGITTFVNGRMCRMVGYEASELVGRCCFDLIHPDDRPRGTAAFERRKQGDTAAREYRVIRKNGEMIWIHFSGAPLRDASGALAGILGMCTDITERKLNEARYQTLFATSQDGVLIVNERGIYVDVNPSFCTLLKTTREQLVGSEFAPYIPKDRLADAEAAFHKLIATGRYEGEFPLVASDGTIVELEWRSVGNFVPGLHCCMARDIGERKRFEQQIQQTQKLESLGVMAGGIAHDFNNLLVGMLGNASLALESSRDRSIEPMLHDVVTASERAAGLVRQMLAYAGQGRPSAALTDVAALIRETVTLLKASIPKTVALQLELGAGPLWVESDPAQLQQVVMNMVINAAESIGDGSPGLVTVTAATRRLIEEDRARSIIPIELTDAPYVEIRFTDTGCGMTSDVQRKIFDPFFTTKFTGRGLGLSAVLGIVRSHGGTLALESTPGQGSTFRVLLPAAQAAAPAAREDAPRATAKQAASILVVDDEEVVRSLARRALEHHGYSVRQAASGAEAIDIVAAYPDISAVVLDLAMPGMTGDQVAPLLRARRPELPIILVSGYTESQALRRSGAGDITAFLQKPFTARALTDKVASVLSTGASNAAKS
ncbi:MAG TPA: PAS domain S-box protein [Bryobacteraceae bacterium]